MPANTVTPYRAVNVHGRDKRIWWKRNTIPGKYKLSLKEKEYFEDKIFDVGGHIRYHSPKPRRVGNGKKVKAPWNLGSLHNRVNNRYYVKQICKNTDYVLKTKATRVKILYTETFGLWNIYKMENGEIQVKRNTKKVYKFYPRNVFFDRYCVLIERTKHCYIYFHKSYKWEFFFPETVEIVSYFSIAHILQVSQLHSIRNIIMDYFGAMKTELLSSHYWIDLDHGEISNLQTGNRGKLTFTKVT